MHTLTFYLKSGHVITIRCTDYDMTFYEDGMVKSWQFKNATPEVHIDINQVDAVRIEKGEERSRW